MKWFYSGAKSLDDIQNTPEKSLGGFRSSTIVPNGKINSMFNDFSSLTIQDGVIETKGFFIKNTFPYSVKNVSVYATYPEDPKLDFQLSATKGEQMEILKSSSDTPYYSEFFDIKVVFAYCDLKIKNTFVAGETVTIEDVEISVPDKKIETFLNNAVKAFDIDLRYKATIIDTNVLRLTYRTIGIYTNTPVVQTTNSGTIIVTPFANGFDNSRLIASELKPDESIGIFLQRKPVDYSKRKTFDDFKIILQEFENSDWEQVQNSVEKNINFCFEWIDVKN